MNVTQAIVANVLTVGALGLIAFGACYFCWWWLKRRTQKIISAPVRAVQDVAASSVDLATRAATATADAVRTHGPVVIAKGQEGVDAAKQVIATHTPTVQVATAQAVEASKKAAVAVASVAASAAARFTPRKDGDK